MSTMSPSAPVAAPAVHVSGVTAGLRLLGRGTRFVLMLLVCLSGSLLALGTALGRYSESSTTGELSAIHNTLILLALVGAVLAAGALWRRHTAPYAVTLVTAAMPLVLPLDATAALFALAALIRVRTGRWVWACGGLVALATTVALFRDASGATTGSSMLKSLTSVHEPGAAVPVDLSIWVPLIVALALFGSAVGAGLFMRSRLDLVAIQTRADAAQQSTTVLTDRLGRQAERDLIAREVHDVIGHRLSLLSLHAGGLEVAAGQDPRLAHSASLVREGAQQAMDDLRSLLNVLREPEATAFNRTAMPSLSDLPAVIEETVDGGMPVVSTVYLSQAEDADPALARAVYRIVQELLTNARRHAPGAPVRLLVQGGPTEGLRIETANRLTTLIPGPPGNGLTGISERVDLWRGTMRHGLDQGHTFRVAIHLPWVAAAQEVAS
ncbi:histidine kinase [Ornithinimicrobium sp. F0845]|uniref:sensor histidine kinase n=1 Tax=Ornithinimicrobium sp. F0845 TaxID=2926412 RepID=UPI001FF3D106|nr:histidine kinase [Ornithinimicrobium sp. F0845]MCK0111711.1 histidine kinase [Ornithinimicrobium sp. F0845]